MTDNERTGTVDLEAEVDSLCKVLSNRRRRFVVSHLAERDAPVRLDDIAAELASWERDEDRPTRSTSRSPRAEESHGTAEDERIESSYSRTKHGTDEVASISTALYHLHLPAMADAGIVEFDPQARTVRYRGRPELKRLAELVAETESGIR